jgi:hypothetical protein
LSALTALVAALAGEIEAVATARHLDAEVEQVAAPLERSTSNAVGDEAMSADMPTAARTAWPT